MGRGRFATACAALALSCGAGAYAAFGNLGQEELHGTNRIFGPFHLPATLLVVALMLTSAIGVGALIYLMRSGLLFGRAALIPVATSGAALVTGWGWRELTAAYAALRLPARRLSRSSRPRRADQRGRCPRAVPQHLVTRQRGWMSPCTKALKPLSETSRSVTGVVR
jgi:hypothetical protein